MSAPKTWEKALRSVKTAPLDRENGMVWGNLLVKSRDLKFSGLPSRLMVSCSEHL
jgi:hypothetical protein